MWQYGSTGRVAGISGDVDMDICYVDYPALIKRGGYNGFPKANPEPLDTEIWWKKGDKDKGIYAVKQRMIALGFVRLDNTSGFGGGTESAVKTLQEQWGYEPTGEIGKNFVDRVMR
jgi:peptidoglycan hydrolase-like protein with peptidoglycan-binding domain